MAVSLAEASFQVVDGLEAEALLLFVLADRRPLRGVAGIVDWRLCGELSRSLVAGGITGAVGERLLMPTHGRVGAKRLLVFGVGPTSRALPAAELASMLAMAKGAGASELAVEFPDNASPEAAAEAARGFAGKLLVLGGSEALREKLGGAAKGGGERSSKRA